VTPPASTTQSTSSGCAVEPSSSAHPRARASGSWASTVTVSTRSAIGGGHH
jgi:hypothetical protein